MPTMTKAPYEHLVNAIRRGHGVMIRDKVINRIEDLPTPAEWHAGEVEKLKSLEEPIADQIKALQAKQAELQAAMTAKAAEPPREMSEREKAEAAAKVQQDLLLAQAKTTPSAEPPPSAPDAIPPARHVGKIHNKAVTN